MLRLSAKHRKELFSLARAALPNEGCGLLAGELRGEEKVLQEIYPLTNIEQSPGRFSMAPEEQFQAVAAIREKGLRLLGNFHSHPRSPALPSEEDIRLAVDPDLSYVIISLHGKRPVLKSFIVREGTVWEEIQRDLIEHQSPPPGQEPAR